jgi:tetratricopeptide (TPR) repeat protein
MKFNSIKILLVLCILILSSCNFFISKEEKIKEFTKQGKIAFDKKDYNKADEMYSSIIKIDSLNGNAYANLGFINFYSNKFIVAIKMFDQAIKINAIDEVYFYRGLSKQYLHEYKDAICDYDTAISLDNSYAKAYHNRGLCYENLGEYNKAIYNCKTAIELNSSPALRAVAYTIIGASEDALGKYDSAFEYYSQAIIAFPQYSEAYYQRASLYLSKNKPNEAILDCTKAIAYNKNNGLYYKGRGLAYWAASKTDSACLDFKKAAEFGTPGAENFARKVCVPNPPSYKALNM